MRLPFGWLRKKRSPALDGLEPVRSLFSKFRRIQKLNTSALERISEMERALGGEYIFDRAFLESSVRDLGKLVYQVVYSVNAMSENRHVSLFDRFQSIKTSLEDILGGGLGPFAASLTLPYSSLSWDLEPLAGVLNVCLAEAAGSLGLLAPDGFAVTATGCALFMKESGSDAASRRSGPDAFAGARFPAALEEAVRREMESLLDRRNGVNRFTVRVCAAGGSREERLDQEGQPGVGAEDVVFACETALRGYAQKTAASGAALDAPIALAVHEDIPAYVYGSISTAPSVRFPAGLFSVIAAPVGFPQKEEKYLLRRTYPYELVESEIHAKKPGQFLYPGATPLSRTRRGAYRGSALLGPGFLRAVAECALTVERILGCPIELSWARGEADRPVILDVRFPGSPEAGAGCELEDALQGAEILLKGGETVQAGIGAGRTVRIPEDFDPEQVPHGAVAISRSASPRLSPVLRKASALITEVGSSIGHLATIARELRVPAIFGAADALERIPEGIDVTVDAGECTVYNGIVEPLLACRECGTELDPGDQEYVVLRHLLRWIMPLDLTDPESADFSAENCRSYHDIIHFSHEKSVEELLHIQDRGRGLAGLQTRRIQLEAPLDLFVLDLGGGISPKAGDSISREEVTSEPFAAFLRGLSLKEMWGREPASLKLRDILSGLDRTFEAMTGASEYAGRNHAIVAENYMNIGLRLGYHFSVVDSYLCDNVNQNYIYFRFVGGFADAERRRRRAGLICSILDGLRFKTAVKGDLVIGRLKIGERAEMSAALTCLGELTGFTRQLDLSMASEDTVQRFSALFAEKSALGGAAPLGEEPADA